MTNHTNQRPGAEESFHLLKNDRLTHRFEIDTSQDEKRETPAVIRCPQCGWRPSPSSRWCCEWSGAPEPKFDGCGSVWNTFATRGRCPGCEHQWQWTSCLRCSQWSPHGDWYESADDG